jgi:hypothetical protein
MTKVGYFYAYKDVLERFSMIANIRKINLDRLLYSGVAMLLIACSANGPPSEADVKSQFSGDPANVKVISIAGTPGDYGCTTKKDALSHRDEYPAILVLKEDLGQCGKIPMPGVNCGERISRLTICMYQDGGKWVHGAGFGG